MANMIHWDPSKPHRIVGESSLLRLILQQIEKVARSDYNVLITGETGVGKELVARNIHLRSKRFQRPFIPVNCGGISESLLEGELFGHERHSFTGAAQSGKQGKIELANGGSLFLDEVGELSIHGQLALLRAIENKSIVRIGGGQETPVDFRIISATNVDLEEALNEEKLRQDFYHRINVLRFHIPPLRERKSDIPLLVYYFMERYCSEQGTPSKRLDKKAMDMLLHYSWPGNIRELENLVKRCTVYVDDPEIIPEDLESIISQSDREDTESFSGASYASKRALVKAAIDMGISIGEYERLVLEVLGEDFSPLQIVQITGITKSALYRKLVKYEIERSGDPPRGDSGEVERLSKILGPGKNGNGNGTGGFFSRDEEDEELGEEESSGDTVPYKLRRVEELVISDIGYHRLLGEGRDAIKAGDRQTGINCLEATIDRLKQLNDIENEDAVALAMGSTYQEIAIHYRDQGMLREAVEVKEEGIRCFKRVEHKLENPHQLWLGVARDYLTIANLKYKLNEDDSNAFRQAEVYLWALFEQGKLNDNLSFEDLIRALRYSSRSLRNNGDVIINLERQKVVYEHVIKNSLHLSGCDPQSDLGEVEGKLKLIQSRVG